jgi:hypothetical protein
MPPAGRRKSMPTMEPGSSRLEGAVRAWQAVASSLAGARPLPLALWIALGLVPLQCLGTITNVRPGGPVIPQRPAPLIADMLTVCVAVVAMTAR